MHVNEMVSKSSAQPRFFWVELIISTPFALTCILKHLSVESSALAWPNERQRQQFAVGRIASAQLVSCDVEGTVLLHQCQPEG